MQVAMIVRDLEAAMKRHWGTLQDRAMGCLSIRDRQGQNYTYRGKPATHTCLIAFVWSGDTQLELIQPLTGYSIYDEHLERRGEGLGRVKLYHADCAKAVREYAARGYPVCCNAARSTTTSTTTSIGGRPRLHRRNSATGGGYGQRSGAMPE